MHLNGTLHGQGTGIVLAQVAVILMRAGQAGRVCTWQSEPVKKSAASKHARASPFPGFSLSPIFPKLDSRTCGFPVRPETRQHSGSTIGDPTSWNS
ncbi:hypothetical protein F4778DRAFT_124833 [Xylariomycetidae sp. FL2044]|nr:hypothetical protein F4778DRAFT_124833 [Xylariomycetidae sp. FL2044]